VEFGIKWGINRLGGGFVQGFTLENRKHGADTAFCKQSIRAYSGPKRTAILVHSGQ